MENLLDDLSFILYCFVSCTSFIVAAFLIIKRPLSSVYAAKRRLVQMIGERSAQQIGISRINAIVSDDRDGNVNEKMKSHKHVYERNRHDMRRLRNYLEDKLKRCLDRRLNDIDISVAAKSASTAKERLVTMVKSLNREYEGRSDCNENHLF